MKKRLLSAVIFVAVLAVAFVLKATVSNYFFDALILAIATVGAFEMSKMMSKMGKYNNKIIATLAPIFIMLSLILCIIFESSISLIYTILIEIGVIVVLGAATFLTSLFTRKRTKEEIGTRKLTLTVSKFSFLKAANTLATFIYPSFMVMFLALINHFENMPSTFAQLAEFGGNISLFVLILAFLIPIITDTFAYLVGGLIGGKKLAPKISPNKTISGAVGGFVFCVLLTIVVFFIFNAIPAINAAFTATGITIWKVAIIALIGSILGQVGDLFESHLKRTAGIKDSGKFMPGHGGMLDRFDSHIFVAPFMFIAFCILFVVI